MTKQEVHEMLCKLPDEEKMALAVSCHLNGLDIEKLEESMSSLITGVKASMENAL